MASTHLPRDVGLRFPGSISHIPRMGARQLPQGILPQSALEVCTGMGF